MRIVFILLFVVLFSTKVSSQNKVNDYEYIIVPERFDFLDADDKYELNSLTKFLFKKHGFKAFKGTDSYPDDLMKNSCKGLKVSVLKSSSLFLTKLEISLKDCNDIEIFKSSVGKSKEKDYRKAYHQALRNAFEDIKALNYKFNENNKIGNSDINKGITKEKNSSEISVDKASVIGNEKLSYVFSDINYIMKKETYGYELIKNEKGIEISIGKIYKSNKGDVFIVKAEKLNGLGYFDEFYNFILERINPVTDQLIKDVFARE